MGSISARVRDLAKTPLEKGSLYFFPLTSPSTIIIVSSPQNWGIARYKNQNIICQHHLNPFLYGFFLSQKYERAMINFKVVLILFLLLYLQEHQKFGLNMHSHVIVLQGLRWWCYQSYQCHVLRVCDRKY